LIAWIADFVKRQSANYQSILQYLSTIGYEWIYFTNFQPIDSWTDEDFTETYDEMLDYKKSILGNQDITYAARRLQSLHNFAETNFGLTKVTIEQAESKLKVRAQLLSVHQYLAFLEQLTLNTQGLDGMMVRVFYILAFRTGMRKKELLGLKFSDI
jgi:integrase